MSRTVHKFALDQLVNRLTLGTRPVVALVAHQFGAFATIWIEHDPDGAQSVRTFYVVGTGHPIPEFSVHVGSAVCNEFVWHVYYRTAEAPS